MAPTISTTRAYPKRKRAQVKYYESDSDDGYGLESDASDIMGLPSSKKYRASPKNRAISSKPLPPKKIFPFASLPAELKNQIYEIALTDSNGVHLISKTRHYRRTVQRDVPSFDHSSSVTARRRKRARSWILGSGSQSQSTNNAAEPVKLADLVPNILLLNKEIYAEARPILYGTNDFFLEDTTALHNFLATIGPANRATLVDLTVKGWGYTKSHKAMNYPAFSLLGGAVNLQRLHMDCQIHWGGGPQATATQFYRECFRFLESLGTAKGKFDAAVDLIEVLPGNFERYRYYGIHHESKPSYEEDMEEFRNFLRKLLGSG